MREKIFTDEFIIGLVAMAVAHWLLSEGRIYSASFINTFAMVFFGIDIVKKFRNRRKK